MTRFFKLIIAVVFIGMLGACATGPQIAQPNQLTAPTPIAGNSGEFMSPYTTDDVAAEWVDKAVNAKMGSAVGSAAGAYIGSKAMEQIPFVGGFIGAEVGKRVGQEIAIKASGGEEYIKSTSDLSFNDLSELSVFMYAKYGLTENYQSVLDATFAIYPDMKKIYYNALVQASRGRI